MKKAILVFIAAFICCSATAYSVEDLKNGIWSVRLESLADPTKAVNLDSDRFRCERISRDEFRYTNDDATVVIRWHVTPDAVEVTPTVTNRKEGWVFTSMIGPFIPVKTKIEENNLLMPIGFGTRFTKTPQDSEEFLRINANKGLTWCKRRGGKFFEVGLKSTVPVSPSRQQTMQWCAFAGEKDGIYMASHDPEFGFKQFNVRYYPGEDLYRFGLRCHHILWKDETAVLPTAIVRKYKGDWHAGADIYKKWYHQTRTLAPTPSWLKNSTGWLLAILKQQNDEIIWPYGDVAACLADAAQARGLDIIGLFGWTVGGHDRFYPEYDICEKMGGEKALRKALDDLRARGMHSILYVNGQLQDMDGTKHWWEETGKNITVRKNTQAYDFETWHKYSDAPARRHGCACHSTEIWHDKMISLAEMANDLGADGIIFDQLGTRGPRYCYAANHGHRVPAIVTERDRQKNLDDVRRHMAAINPQFIVMTEGTIDSERSAIDIFHGCTHAVYDLKQEYVDRMAAGQLPFHVFPQMLKYTVPEIECTVRHASPVADRMLLNYGTVYGFKHEIESRYAADRRYLLENAVPKPEDYGNVRSKPNIEMMQEVDAVAMRDYSKQVLDMRKKYSECLLDGVFRDDVGLTLKSQSPYVTATVFESKDGKKAAVVVWNASGSDTASFSVSMKGKKIQRTDSPEGNTDYGEIGPQSIKVVLFK